MVDRRPERAADPDLGLAANPLSLLALLAANPLSLLALLAALPWLAGCGAGEPDLDAAELERLRSIGYIERGPSSGSADDRDERDGRVVRHDASRSQDGLNLVHSRTDHRARLVDMQGRVRHEWSTGAADENWNHVELLSGGDVVGIVRGEWVTRIGPDSTPRWRIPLAAHHDLHVGPDGSVSVLASRVVEIEHRGEAVPIIDERIVRLGPDGSFEDEISLHDLLAERLPPERLDAIAEQSRGLAGWWRRLRGPARVGRESPDVYHANSLEILERDTPGLGRAGDALVSVRELDLVAVIDLDARRLVSSFGPGLIEAQHDARPLANGHVLLFDNGRSRGWSRVVEIDPMSGRSVWEWSGEEPGTLHSARKGAAQRLPNGNVLVVESERGRAYEVTREGDVVWEYHSARSIYRLTRFRRGSQEVKNVP